MVAFGHTAVGAAIGVISYESLKTVNPALGLAAAGGLGIISHYITDFIPHGHFIRMHDFKSKIMLIIFFDLFLSIALFLGSVYFTSGYSLRLLYTMFGIGGAQLPDVLDGLIYIGVIPKKGFIKYENNFHQWLHWHGRGEGGLIINPRDIWQLLAILIALLLSFNIFNL